MDELEVFMLVVSAVMAFVGIQKTFIWTYHPLFFGNNPGLGASRAAVWAGWAGAVYVIFRFSASTIVSDPTYLFFYSLMAYAFIKCFGQLDPVHRISYKVDVLERHLSLGGFYLAARTLAVAAVFAGSMIGEGPGFWVVLVFFGMGFAVLEFSVWLMCRVRGWRLKTLLRHEERNKVAVICGWYVAASFVLHRACAGDFVGWVAGFKDFAVKAAPVLAGPATGDPTWLMVRDFTWGIVPLTALFSTTLAFAAAEKGASSRLKTLLSAGETTVMVGVGLTQVWQRFF